MLHSAPRRILDAARVLVSRGGAGAASIGHVAAAAGVSKALVHYHFRDKDSLLQALVEDVGAGVVERGRAFATEPGGAGDNVLDAYWAWLLAEIEGGDLRVLLSLAEYDNAAVQAAVRRVAERRREVTAEQVARVFARLSLTPRIPAELMADTVLAFVDGLAATLTTRSGRDARPAFDVLWLALLTLAE